MLPPRAYQQAKRLLLTGAVAGGALVVTVVTGYVMASPTFGWTGAQSPKMPQKYHALPGWNFAGGSMSACRDVTQRWRP